MTGPSWRCNMCLSSSASEQKHILLKVTEKQEPASLSMCVNQFVNVLLVKVGHMAKHRLRVRVHYCVAQLRMWIEEE